MRSITDEQYRAALADIELAYEEAAADFVSRMPEHLQDYWLHGEGAAKVRWCTSGSFDRARKALLKEGVPIHMVDGAVANLYRRACGKNPGAH